MKTFLKLFSLANPSYCLVVQYWALILISIALSVINITLLVPLLEILFANKNPETGLMELTESNSSYFQWIKSYLFSVIDLDQMSQFEVLSYFCVVIIMASLVSNVLRYMAVQIMTRFQMRLMLNIRMMVYHKITSLPIGYFIDNSKGQVITRMINDTIQIQQIIVNSFFTLIKDPIKAIIILIVMSLTSWQLTLGSLLIVPVLGLLVSQILRRMKGDARASKQRLGNLVGILDETINGIKVIYGFNAVEQFRRKFLHENDQYNRNIRSLVKKTELASPTSEFLSTVMVALIVLSGGLLIFSTEAQLEPETFIGFILLVSQLLQPIKHTTSAFSGLQEGVICAERVMEIVTLPDDVEKGKGNPTPTFAHQITFDDVHFGYGEAEVIRGMSFHIRHGESVALVGPSGGGKTTIADLLCGFVKPQRGRILIDGLDVTEYSQWDLSGLFGIVNQEAILFNDTVANNIAVGAKEVDMERVRRVAKVALADGFIEELEQGYDTVLGEKGDKLSGGQRQRLCLARAIYREPQILILDEATSALDTKSEKLVQEALRNIMQGRTSLVIAHRLSTIRHADQILVIERGQIANQGTHEELLRTSPIYQQLNQSPELMG